MEMILYASPQALALGRHGSGILRQAHFITSSEKGVSEPSWVGQFEGYTESGALRSQDDCHRIAEQLETKIFNSL
jgi:hypothetical protein